MIIKQILIQSGDTDLSHFWLTGDATDEEVESCKHELRRFSYGNIQDDTIPMPEKGTEFRHIHGERERMPV